MAKVVGVQRCALCGRLARGDVCKICMPSIKAQTRKIALEMKAKKGEFPGPIIA